jgi:methyl-accepting chemotaxis protein
MTDTAPVADPEPADESLFDKFKQWLKDTGQDIEHESSTVAADASHVADDVETDTTTLAPAVEEVVPEADPVVDAVEDVAKETVSIADDVEAAVPPGGATIDDTVTQGNRVTTVAAQTENNPVKILTDKIKDHFDAVTPIIADLRATVDSLDTELNKLRAGL